MRAVRVRVTGRVQGVFYRGWTQEEAEALGLKGWVRNERDGSVTALIAGPKGKVSQMVDALWEGPGAASVNYVATEELELGERPSRFTIQ
jgi:acylphosphatase